MENNPENIILEEKYMDELLNKNIIEHLKKSEEDIKNGRTKPAEIVFKEFEKKYGF